MIAKPFIKWVGGKGQLLSQLEARLPDCLSNEDFTYIEPFVGGGAMMFFMLQKFPNIHKVVINDINEKLTDAYKMVKLHPVQLVSGLQSIEKEYLSLIGDDSRKDFYLQMREKFNGNNLNRLERTVLLMFLNRTCFNGLYRENSKGKFNVPFGGYENPTICNEELIYADSEFLNRFDVEILNGDFSVIESEINDKGLNFLYFDPPYRPLSSTSSFNSYVSASFNDDEQRRLAEFCAKISQRGRCLWLLSNSDCSAKNPKDLFFENLYSKYEIQRVYASRAVNSVANKRGKLTELLINNSCPSFQTDHNIGIMKIHSKEQFEVFLSQLKETNATLDFFCDFGKISQNVDKISMKLNQLNYLIGQQNMTLAIQNLWEENPKVFSVLDILIAIRSDDHKKAISKAGKVQFLEHFFETPEGVIEFIKDTGLQSVLENRQIKNLVDYVFGVETGLDSNARKNRSGHIMEKQVAGMLEEAGVKYRKEIYSTEYPELSVLGEDKKRFDYVIETPKCKYLVEVNFYSGGGSKLNEVARAYSELSPKINSVDGFEFVWITDGRGWLSARSELEEAYYVIPHLYNLTSIQYFINVVKSEL